MNLANKIKKIKFERVPSNLWEEVNTGLLTFESGRKKLHKAISGFKTV